MEVIKQTTKEYFKVLSIVHMALVMGPIFGGLISVMLSINKITIIDQDESFYKVLLYVVSAFYAIGLIANPYIFRSKLASIKNNQDLGHKISNYRSALITRYALIEGLAYFSLVATFITSRFIFLAYLAFSVLLLIYWRPTKENLIADLELNRDETGIINNPDAVISVVTTNRY